MARSGRKGKPLIEDMTAAQCRMARAALSWSQDALADEARVSKPTIADFEREARVPMPQNRIALRRAFEAAGLVFLPENGEGSGVRFRAKGIEGKDKPAPSDDDMPSGAE